MWIAFGIYWLIAAPGTKKIEVSESAWFRVLWLGILLITFVLLLWPWLRMGWLGRRFVAETAIGQGAGLTLTVAGLLLCIWARRTLGDYWSDKVALESGSSVDPARAILASAASDIFRRAARGAGTALAIGEWREVIALALLGANYFVKAKREDRILASRFGEKFAEYKRQAGFLMPRW